MRTFDVQTVMIDANPDIVFEYVANRYSLPKWTSAFERVGDRDAILRTPAGSTTIDLRVHAVRPSRSVDWEMRFPDGSVAWAWSRVVPHRDGSLFSFVLPAFRSIGMRWGLRAGLVRKSNHAVSARGMNQ